MGYIAAETKQDEDICIEFRSDDPQFAISLRMVDTVRKACEVGDGYVSVNKNVVIKIRFWKVSGILEDIS